MSKILLNRYHPIVEDLAITFTKLGHEVDVSFNISISDHYGNWSGLLKEAKTKYKEFNSIPLQQALMNIKKKKYDLVGCDGVFDGDKDVMDLCTQHEIPFFNIQGYPRVLNEPSYNILSLGWFTPQSHYVNNFAMEHQVKEWDWKGIADAGQSPSRGKNFCVFYPNFWYMDKEFKISFDTDRLVSGIQRYEECNRHSYEVFRQVQSRCEWPVVNLEGKPHDEFLEDLKNSCGLLHLKHGDQPGIAIFEAMLMGRPVFTLRSFILNSFNQDVLIDGYNAIVADSVDELIDGIHNVTWYSGNIFETMCGNAVCHASLLTSFDRQEHKLRNFIERCLEK